MLPISPVSVVCCLYLQQVLCVAYIPGECFVLTISLGSGLCCLYLQRMLCVAYISSECCVLLMYPVNVVCCLYLQRVLCVAFISVSVVLPISPASVVCCLYLRRVLCVAYISSECCVLPISPAHLTSLKSKLQKAARRQFPLTRLIACSSSPGAHWRDQLAGLFSTDCVKALEESLDVHQEDALLLGVGNDQQVLELLGKTRLELADQLESQGLRVRESGFHFLWVVDFPLFVAGEGAPESTHHPFTHPHPDDVHLLRQQPLEVRSLHYDLVLNGCEVGGGSVRIHDPLLQGQVLDYLGVDQGPLQHLLDALSSGCPPHAGIALGIQP
uniref:(California timema) hypothetical protein n=1 Tax=Timema californicum TaxID=61474 RepID=A0A7R9PE05_TIMCA|nr:unnamed protein product [Timema californicum]